MSDDIDRYKRNLQNEIDGAAIYRALADGEDNPALAQVYTSLAATEERHAQFWAERLRSTGHDGGPATPTRQARVLMWAARRLGPQWVLPTIAQQERSGRTMYDDQPEASGTSLAGDERSHARVLREMESGMAGNAIARLEGRHRSIGGNALRAAVLGANDGLVSNLSLVMGVAGAALPPRAILITGMAGLLAGAFSMAMGEWVSVRSASEAAQRQLEIEADELDTFPEEETEELRLIYQAKGLPSDIAATLAERLMGDPEIALQVKASEELGINPDELEGSPMVAAVSSFVLFAVGAVIPVLPFLFASGSAAVIPAVLGSGVGLFGLGAAITMFTGRSALRSGMRQLLIGWGAAVVTYGLGAAIGVSLT